MHPIVLIPARMAASRLPGKPLADIGGLPLIVRVLRQAQAAGIGPVAVAAGDAEIASAVEAVKMPVCSPNRLSLTVLNTASISS